eukprot:1196264-Prorocentrum_minimum.AAC.3
MPPGGAGRHKADGPDGAPAALFRSAPLRHSRDLQILLLRRRGDHILPALLRLVLTLCMYCLPSRIGSHAGYILPPLLGLVLTLGTSSSTNGSRGVSSSWRNRSQPNDPVRTPSEASLEPAK